MQEDLAILLEWLEANGIFELFNDNIELGKVASDTYDNVMVSHAPKNIENVVDALFRQQNGIKKNSQIFGDNEQIREFSDRVTNIEDIINFANSFYGYENFRKTANSTILLSGNVNSEIVIVNDIPNTDDDNNNSIFSGDSGILLENILNSVFKKRENLCFLNLFFWRLPGGRTPIKEEINYCKPLVEKLISIIKPKFIVFCGSYGVSTFLEENKTIFNVRGKIVDYTNCYMQDKIKSTATYSPYLLLKNSIKKKDFWDDVLFISNYMNNIKG